MTITTPSIKLITADPELINTGDTLYISMPILNRGLEVAANVFITSITLGTAPRLSPLVLPIFLGSIANGGNIRTVKTRFNALNLIPNQKYLLTVRGTYGESTGLIGFAVNRYVKIPTISIFPIEMLKARVQARLELLTWNYTIYNDEPKGSQQFVSAFSLDIAAPVTVTGTPTGWTAETDNLSFVGWFAADSSMPYPNHVRPGESLSGFQIKSSIIESESTPYILTSWRQDSDKSGLVVADYVATPRRLL